MMTEAGRALLDDLRQSDPKDPRQLELPWEGRSPRSLTRGAKLGRLLRETATLDEFFDEEVVEDQHRRFLQEVSSDGEGVT